MRIDSFYLKILLSFVLVISFFHAYDFQIPKNLGFVPKIFCLIQYGESFHPFWSCKSVDKGCVIPVETFRFCFTVNVNLKSFHINNNFSSDTYSLLSKKKIFQTKLIRIHSKLEKTRYAHLILAF